ncbi:hypothetical protein JF550_02815 [Microbacterium esteraromaticum]|uniref:Uncharacterized protein n=1 Tax=Microbacterium esteraromaticum TaxID=57043 RepID=A0A939DTZ2_9MICO|nr:hypothetical protein [Microbacterium esteraromaticum]MBN8204886.1 hypothetical protein [Microbacterium esteraromaticum]MBN8415040.1 hypothetical protein [Microbacterium esteraromaticum]
MGNILIGEDAESSAIFELALTRQAALNETHERVQAARAQAASVMGADNTATNPLQVEQFVAYCLVQAVDLGRSMCAMTRSEDGTMELPLMAMYPLVRAQVESASMALWVMSGPDRRSRVLRRLQAAHDELIHEKALTNSALKGRSVSDEQRLRRSEALRQQKHKALIRAVGDANSIERDEYENALPGWEFIVRHASETMGLEKDELVVIWRLASGFTHPSFRRGASVLEFAPTDVEGNVLTGVLSTHTSWLASVVSFGAHAANRALDFWRDSKIRVNGERPVPVPVVPTFTR